MRSLGFHNFLTLSFRAPFATFRNFPNRRRPRPSLIARSLRNLLKELHDQFRRCRGTDSSEAFDTKHLQAITAEQFETRSREAEKDKLPKFHRAESPTDSGL